MKQAELILMPPTIFSWLLDSFENCGFLFAEMGGVCLYWLQEYFVPLQFFLC